MAQVSRRPIEEWSLIVHGGSQLPLPSEVKWNTDIPGTLMLLGQSYEIVTGDHLITATMKNKYQNWSYVYSLYAVHPGDDKLVRVPYGALHRTIIKHAEGTKDIMPGTGTLAAIVREIHAIRRGVLNLGFEPKPVPLTRYQRPWVI